MCVDKLKTFAVVKHTHTPIYAFSVINALPLACVCVLFVWCDFARMQKSGFAFGEWKKGQNNCNLHPLFFSLFFQSNFRKLSTTFLLHFSSFVKFQFLREWASEQPYTYPPTSHLEQQPPLFPCSLGRIAKASTKSGRRRRSVIFELLLSLSTVLKATTTLSHSSRSFHSALPFSRRERMNQARARIGRKSTWWP